MASQPLRRIGVVNRGEPAVRFLSTLRAMAYEGDVIESVALFTDSDKDALFVRQSNHAVHIGAGRDAYLNAEIVIAALKSTDCDAAWLGWGFASEDADFAAALEAEGIILLAPHPETMRALGDKIHAKTLAEQADVPVAPWAIVESAGAAMTAAAEIGFPLLIKAAGGGGGRGIRRVDALDEVEAAFESARDEAARSFRSHGLMLEKCIEDARHVEVQIFGDGAGGVSILGLRDCSLQRRRQKVIEECPAPQLPDHIQKTLTGAAKRLCARVGYRSAGTVEFLYEADAEAAYFLEVNTRLQVEHPVTEAVYGIDLIRAQIDLVRTGAMPDATPRGWAIEARLCAEDPANHFMPSPGRLVRLVLPQGPGVRVDTGFAPGEEISPEFDPLIAKIIAWGPTRLAAIGRLSRALVETRVIVERGATNLGLLKSLLKREDFRAGTAHTGIVDALELTPPDGAGAAALAAAVDRFLLGGDTALSGFDRHRVEAVEPLTVYRIGPTVFRIQGAGGAVTVDRVETGDCECTLRIGEQTYAIERAPEDTRYVVDGESFVVGAASGGSVTAPSAALVLALPHKSGDRVEAGACVAIVESMKMEVRVETTRGGVVREISVRVGEQVSSGQVLVIVEGEGARTTSAGIRWETEIDQAGAVERLTAGMIGWDVDPVLAAADRAHLSGTDVRALLRAIADIAEVFERRADGGGRTAGAAGAVTPWTWLETLRQRGPDALGERQKGAVARALRHLKVDDWDSSNLKDGLLRLARAGRRLDVLSATALDALAVLPESPGEVPIDVLDRLANLDPQRFWAVREAADNMRHELYERPAYEMSREGAEARAEALLERLRDGSADWVELLDVPESLLGYLVPEALGGCTTSIEAIARRLEWHEPEVSVEQLGEHPAYRVGFDRVVAVGSAKVLLALADANLFEPFEQVDLVTGWPDEIDDVLHTGLIGKTVCVVAVGGEVRPVVRWYDPSGGERAERRDILPSTAYHVDLDRLCRFKIKRLPSGPDIALFHATAHANPTDIRLLAFAEVRNVESAPDSPLHLPTVERIFHDALRAIRIARAKHDPQRKLQWNRLSLSIRPVVPWSVEGMRQYAVRLAPAALPHGLEKVVVRARFQDLKAPGGITPWMDLTIMQSSGRLKFSVRPAKSTPLEPLSKFESKLVAARRRGHVHPYELIASLESGGDIPRGRFEEYDLNPAGMLIPVHRPRGENNSGVVVGTLKTRATELLPATHRILLLSDPIRQMGALAEAECRRVIGALDLAESKGLPLEWVAVSAGARIDLTTGTENLDWTARVLARIVQFTQAGHEINIIVPGLCVGAQAYWNAEATMMMHTRGLLVMTDAGSMVLTGKRALDLSGCVSAEDDLALGGYTSIMGPNGQAQAWAADLAAAYQLLYQYYGVTYANGKRPVRLNTQDASDRDVTQAPYPAYLNHDFETIGDLFSLSHNPDRKRPFAVRPIMQALADIDTIHVERWSAMRDAEIAVVWETRIGGYAATMIGIENRPMPRLGRTNEEGPDVLAGGTLYPQAARKIARALNAASGRRPAVVVANLSGFDGSPESLAQWQLEYGAEIGRAVVNFDGPIIFAITSRYHGGAYVVFSKALNPQLHSMALEGSFASVIGGAPAAAIVLSREVRRRAQIKGGGPDAQAEATAAVAAEFDAVHTVARAKTVGSLDEIIAPRQLRPRVIEILARDYERVMG